MGELVKRGCTYKHYKGSFYYVIGFAMHENTQETLVLYKRMGKEQVFARPVEQFLQKGKSGRPRFTLVEKLNV